MSRPLFLSRRSVLCAAGAVTAATVTGCWGSPDHSDPSDPNPSQESAIFDLSFKIESRYRPFELVAPAFTAVTSGAGAVEGLAVSDHTPAAPFAAVEVDVDALTGPVCAGLATSGDEHLLAVYDPASQRASIEVRRGGRTTTVARKKARLPGSFRFAFALCENRVTVLADTGDGCRCSAGARRCPSTWTCGSPRRSGPTATPGARTGRRARPSWPAYARGCSG